MNDTESNLLEGQLNLFDVLLDYEEEKTDTKQPECIKEDIVQTGFYLPDCKGNCSKCEKYTLPCGWTLF